MESRDVMMSPPIESLMERTHSKFALVALAASRARQLTEYLRKGGVSRSIAPTQVSSVASKPLSIAFEEIAVGKIVAIPIPEEPTAEEAADEAELERAADELAVEMTAE